MLNDIQESLRKIDESSREQSELFSDALSKRETQIADQSYIIKWLQEELNKERTQNEFRENLRIDMKDVDFTVLSSANPKLLDELYTLCKICQHTIITQSLKIRKVEGIAYRDGAVDSLEILKAKFKEFFQVVKNTRKNTEESKDDTEEE